MIRVLYILSFIFLIACGNKSSTPDGSTAKGVDDFSEFAASIEDPSIYQDSDGSEGKPVGWFNPIDTLGSGVISIPPFRYTVDDQIEGFPIVSLYNNPECTDLYVRYNSTLGKVPTGRSILPIYSVPDYDYYYFITVSENDISYEVAINADETKYIKKEGQINYSTWEEFYENVFYIEQSEQNPFRVSPKDDAEIVTIEFYDDEVVDFIYSNKEVNIEGEWMYITFPNVGNQKGIWVRWREGNKLILGVHFTA